MTDSASLRGALAAAGGYILYVGIRENALCAVTPLGIPYPGIFVQLICIGAWLMLTHFLGTTPARFAGWRRVPAYTVPTALITGAALQFAMILLLEFIPFTDAMRGANEAAVTSSPLWVTLIGAVLLAPLLEETVFRGIIADRACRILPAPAAAVFSGILFAMLHHGLVAMTAALITGTLFAFLYYSHRSVVVTALTHAGFNLAGCIAGQFSPLAGSRLYIFGAAGIALSAAGIIILTKKRKAGIAR